VFPPKKHDKKADSEIYTNEYDTNVQGVVGFRTIKETGKVSHSTQNHPCESEYGDQNADTVVVFPFQGEHAHRAKR